MTNYRGRKIEETMRILATNGPMRWYLFAVGGGEDGSVKVLPVPDFKYDC
jgi:hypothetical protein